MLYIKYNEGIQRYNLIFWRRFHYFFNEGFENFWTCVCVAANEELRPWFFGPRYEGRPLDRPARIAYHHVDCPPSLDFLGDRRCNPTMDDLSRSPFKAHP